MQNNRLSAAYTVLIIKTALQNEIYLIGRSCKRKRLLQGISHVQTKFQILLHVLQRLVGGEASIYNWPSLAEKDGTGEAGQLKNLENILLLEASSVSQGHTLC